MKEDNQNRIPLDDPRYAAAERVLDAMHDYFKLDPLGGAVRYIIDTDGRMIVFTRGEYRQAVMDAVGGPLSENLFSERIIGDELEE